MQFRIPFRLVRGLTVIVAIVVAHYSIAWGLNHLRISTPDLGPVFATLLGDPEESDDAKNSTDAQDSKRAADSKESAASSKNPKDARAAQNSGNSERSKSSTPSAPQAKDASSPARSKSTTDMIPVQIVDETPRKAAPR